MLRGAYHHAIILPAACLTASSRPECADQQSHREVLYNSDDLARHMANFVMNQIPTVSVAHISSRDFIPPNLWRDPLRVYACLFAQASRVLFLVTKEDVDRFGDFLHTQLRPLLKRPMAVEDDWKSRFLVVAMGYFDLPRPQLCDVVRFREVGWFRDSMALFVLGQKIQDFWTARCHNTQLTSKNPGWDFVATLEETETFQSLVTVKTVTNDDTPESQRVAYERLAGTFDDDESVVPNDDVRVLARRQTCNFQVDIETNRSFEIHEPLVYGYSLANLDSHTNGVGRQRPYSAVLSEPDFYGWSSVDEAFGDATDDNVLELDDTHTTSSSAREMQWSSPDSISLPNEAKLQEIVSAEENEPTLVVAESEDFEGASSPSNDTDETLISSGGVADGSRPPKPARRERIVDVQRDDQLQEPPLVIKRKKFVRDEDGSVGGVTDDEVVFPVVPVAPLENPLESIIERSVEDDPSACQTENRDALPEPPARPKPTTRTTQNHFDNLASVPPNSVNSNEQPTPETVSFESGDEEKTWNCVNPEKRNYYSLESPESPTNPLSNVPRSLEGSPFFTDFGRGATRGNGNASGNFRKRRAAPLNDATSDYISMTSPGPPLSQVGLHEETISEEDIENTSHHPISASLLSDHEIEFLVPQKSEPFVSEGNEPISPNESAVYNRFQENSEAGFEEGEAVVLSDLNRGENVTSGSPSYAEDSLITCLGRTVMSPSSDETASLVRGHQEEHQSAPSAKTVTESESLGTNGKTDSQSEVKPHILGNIPSDEDRGAPGQDNDQQVPDCVNKSPLDEETGFDLAKPDAPCRITGTTDVTLSSQGCGDEASSEHDPQNSSSTVVTPSLSFLPAKTSLQEGDKATNASNASLTEPAVKATILPISFVAAAGQDNAAPSGILEGNAERPIVPHAAEDEKGPRIKATVEPDGISASGPMEQNQLPSEGLQGLEGKVVLGPPDISQISTADNNSAVVCEKAKECNADMSKSTNNEPDLDRLKTLAHETKAQLRPDNSSHQQASDNNGTVSSNKLENSTTYELPNQSRILTSPENCHSSQRVHPKEVGGDISEAGSNRLKVIPLATNGDVATEESSERKERLAKKVLFKDLQTSDTAVTQEVSRSVEDVQSPNSPTIQEPNIQLSNTSTRGYPEDFVEASDHSTRLGGAIRQNLSKTTALPLFSPPNSEELFTVTARPTGFREETEPHEFSRTLGPCTGKSRGKTTLRQLEKSVEPEFVTLNVTGPEATEVGSLAGESRNQVKTNEKTGSFKDQESPISDSSPDESPQHGGRSACFQDQIPNPHTYESPSKQEHSFPDESYSAEETAFKRFQPTFAFSSNRQSPFPDSDCDPEITSATMSRPWHLSPTRLESTPATRPIIVAGSANAVSQGRVGRRTSQDSQASALPSLYYPPQAVEETRSDVVLRRRASVERRPTGSTGRFSTISIDEDSNRQEHVELVDAAVGRSRSKSHAAGDSRRRGRSSPVQILYETGEYHRNISTQAKSGRRSSQADDGGRYFRLVKDPVHSDVKGPSTYWKDRSVGSPTPYALANFSDNTSEISATSDISSVGSREIGITNASKKDVAQALVSVYTALGKASKIISASSQVIMQQVERLNSEKSGQTED
ncbi:unnamed protein product [Mesocestoides corti]|uniref:BRCT domain-containing protein n=1 Tax=Mesocestoides corti TaxID=53468 RepID=A0A0R3ULU4_MESCO|nr:unnamed protein product [Mesocestoides corti]